MGVTDRAITAADDASLVGTASRGDGQSLRDLWQRHRRWVAAVILAHKPREADVEDLLQDVAMTFVRTIGELRDASALKPWLRTVAINTARAAGRRTRRHGHDDPPVERAAAGPNSTPAALADREAAARLVDLARELPAGYREPLILKCVRGMTYRQIGGLLGLPETTVETRIARGRRMLRELATARGLGPPGQDVPGRGTSGSGRIGAGAEERGPATGAGGVFGLVREVSRAATA